MSVTEVIELQRHAELMAAQRSNGVLQVITLLAGHAHLLALDGGLHFELGVLDMRNDLLRQLFIDTFLERGLLLHQLAGSKSVLDLKAFDIDLALDQRQLEDLDLRFQLEVRFGGEVDRQFLELERAFAFEVIATVQLFDGVIDGISDFVFIQLGHYVERGHVISPVAGRS